MWMEGKGTSNLGDVVLSPLQQQHFGSGTHSPNSSGGSKTIRMPTITFENVVSDHLEGQPEESEEDVQELFGVSKKKGGFRKRKKSVHGCGGGGGGGGGSDANYLPPYKQRRMFLRRHISCPGIGGAGGLNKTSLRFLLGGNAHDPLNLNGLGDSDNAMTPKTSPMPLPSTTHGSGGSGKIPIMIPKNYQDPLRLLSEDDVENTRDVIEGILSATCTQLSHKKRRHHRRRSLRKRNESECSVSDSVASEQEHEDVEKITAKVVAQLDVVLSDSNSADIAVLPVAVIPPEPIEVKGEEEKKAIISPANIVVTVPEEKEALPEREPPYPFRVSSDYIPLSSHYQPSPFVMDTMNENFTVLPFESPSMSNYMGTQDTYTITEPFSPPPPRPVDDIIEHRVPSGHYSLGWTPPRNEIQRRQLPSKEPSVQQQAMFNRRNRSRLDPIVSPVFPNLGSGKRSWMPHSTHGHLRHGHNHHKKQEPKVEEQKEVTKPEQKSGHTPKFHPKNKIFRYGNYNQYYGYRNAGNAEDARLRAFKKEWLEGKDVLDIGCNVGHVTLCIGRDFGPRRILGIDIDAYLIKVANKNVKHYMDRDPTDVSIKFPQALSVVHGSLQPPQMGAAAVGRTPEYGQGATPTWTVGSQGSQGERKRIPFPYNVGFRQENYVLESDDLLSTVKAQYDVVICLSTTKWVHLNFGDDGLKRFFRRAFLQLRPGGLFVLEPQPWSSYKKKKKLTEEIFKTFESIKFLPKDFEAFLLKEVGYATVKLVGIPAHHSKGFQRPIYVFTKGTTTKVSSASATVTRVEETEGKTGDFSGISFCGTRQD